jgi:hypothetical protein
MAEKEPEMNNRRGEKLGWTLGLLGGTIWMFIMAAYGLFGGNWRFGAIALAGGLCVVGLVFHLAPWKHPTTQYWKLYLPPVAVMILTAAVLVIGFGPGLSHINWLPGFLCCFLPLLVPNIRGRRWQDGNASKKISPVQEDYHKVGGPVA